MHQLAILEVRAGQITISARLLEAKKHFEYRKALGRRGKLVAANSPPLSADAAMQWWKETSIYQIYPRSFYDANGDGIGDLPGIIEKLDYIKDLGFETIWLSPHYASPQRDFGYDISDYFSVAPEYGDTEDALQLIDEIHSRDMKILFDMILNHTSDQHPWFQESRSSKDNPKRDWYIWRKGNGPGKPPNNWACLPGGSGWKYDNTTDEWFFHNFLDFQPDLNFRNPEVKKAMFDTMRYWLDRGVDGFRLDIFHSIYKDDQFRDNPFSWKYVPTSDFDEGYFQKLEYNINRPESFALAKEVRQVIDEYSPDRFVIGEVFGKDVVKKYLGENQDGLNLILQFDLIELQGADGNKAQEIRNILQRYESEYSPPFLPTYSVGNHDRRRYISRIENNQGLARLLALLQYTARGVPITYYGDEIGIPDGDLPHIGAKDATAHKYWWLPPALARSLHLYVNRDGCRTPMQWDSSPNAGFSKTSSARPWLPVHPDFEICNVEKANKDPYSLLNIHRNLLHLRKAHDSLRSENLQILEGLPESVVGYSRKSVSEDTNIYMNLGPEPVKFHHASGKILFRTDPACAAEGAIELPAWSGIVLQ